jgi:hypothetical protein
MIKMNSKGDNGFVKTQESTSHIYAITLKGLVKLQLELPIITLINSSLT